MAKELGFIKVYTSPYTLTCNSIIEWIHSLLKASIRKLICNHEIDCDETVHIATMAYIIFLHSSAGESPFYLMFGCDPFMPTLLKLILPKLRYMDNEKCRIHLDTMWEIYMMAVLNLKMAWEKSPPPIKDPSIITFKIGDMVLLRNHTPKILVIPNINPVSEFCKKISDKTFELQDHLGKVKWGSI